jgi:hypothetical protein
MRRATLKRFGMKKTGTGFKSHSGLMAIISYAIPLVGLLILLLALLIRWLSGE